MPVGLMTSWKTAHTDEDWPLPVRSQFHSCLYCFSRFRGSSSVKIPTGVWVSVAQLGSTLTCRAESFKLNPLPRMKYTLGRQALLVCAMLHDGIYAMGFASCFGTPKSQSIKPTGVQLLPISSGRQSVPKPTEWYAYVAFWGNSENCGCWNK